MIWSCNADKGTDATRAAFQSHNRGRRDTGIQLKDRIMQKLLAASLAALTLLSLPVAAQTTTTTPPTTTPRSETATPAPTTAPAPAVPSGDVTWYTASSGEMRTSKLIGTTVRNSAGESIGDINEVLLDKTGKVAAVIVGVGGFLGMGEREVAISYESLRMSNDASGNSVISVNTTKDALRSAPAWTWPKT
jgi:sporulation protein YlmC with PRC-barrel domain